MHKPADCIRNVAHASHGGRGKTSLHEAMLFQPGSINRMGSVVDRTAIVALDEPWSVSNSTGEATSLLHTLPDHGAPGSEQLMDQSELAGEFD